MLAQLNSKQKSIFFNLKPTVIDKLISKNKSSIQNSLLYTNEASDGSLSEDSEESSSSSQESSLVTSLHHSSSMAPIRRSEKVNVLGSKLSSRSQFSMKRGPGRPPKGQVGRVVSNSKVIAAKKVLESSKQSSPKKLAGNIRSAVKTKKNTAVGKTPGGVKHSRTSTRKENLPSITESRATNISESVKIKVTRGKPKLLKNIKDVDIQEKKCLHSSSLESQTSSLALLNNKSSTRKFPSNVVDRWKSTGMLVRGCGRPRGSSRGSLRGGMRRGVLRLDRYNTRDSQTGLMRSGKRRKCHDPNLVEGLEGFRKRRRVITQIKTEKSDCPSDEHSSFVTTSELSFYENDNSLKQLDDEVVSTKPVKLKLEIEETEDEIMHPRDTNSNVFKSENKVIKQSKTQISGSDTNNQSNNSKTHRKNMLDFTPKTVGQDRKSLSSLEKIPQSDSSIRDSDCSLDSNFFEDNSRSPKSGLKRQRKKGIDGLWVRRSTRSVGKIIDKAEPDAVVIEELLKEKECSVEQGSKSTCSFNIDDEINCDSSLQLADLVETESPVQNSSIKVFGTTIQENKSPCRFLVDSSESSYKISVSDFKDTMESDPKVTMNNEINDTNDIEPFVDFSLSLEESPVKESDVSIQETKSENPLKLNFDSFPIDVSKQEICDIKTFSASKSEPDHLTNSTFNPVIIKDSTEQKHESISKNLELENLTAVRCQSNNIYKLEDSTSQNICVNNFEKINKASDVNITIKNEVTEALFDKVENKSNEQVCSDREVISDENILSLIDSFCQSDSTNTSVGEEQELSAIMNDENDDRIILDSINEITSEVESRLLQEKSIEKMSGTMLNIPEILDKEMSSAEESVSICKESGKEGSNSNKYITIESPVKNEIAGLVQEGRNEEFDDDITLRNSDPTNDCENLHIQSCYESSMKREIDVDDTVKAPESTEESSSSDSNSNMSELLVMPLDNCSSDINIKNVPIVEQLDKEEKSEILQEEESKHDDERTAMKIEACSDTQVNRFSSLLSKTESNEIGGNDTDIVCMERNISENVVDEENVGERPSKELLSALGLQSLHSTVEEKPKRPPDYYTGTLKAVIKLNRSSDKRSGGRKMIFKQGDKITEEAEGGGDRLEYRICSAEELSTEGVPLTHLADIPANRKSQMKVKSQFDLSNSPNIVGTAGSMETSTATTDASKETGGKQNLIIPEKSSSFSIHPERLCTDVCSYCFGKFGSLDTPCHLAQLKNSERQTKILAIEVHLSPDSCLCDGCFRYVDRKANCPASQRSRKPAARRGPLAGTICAVQDCTQPARHSVRRKWLIKLKKSIGRKLVIDMDKNPHLPFPLCSQHYYWVDYFTVCGICKKRLTRNHMYALGPEADKLNQALSEDGIPVRLSDKLFLCKLCRYYSSLRLKYRDPAAMSSTHRLFLNSYRKKILHYHDIPVSDSEEEGKSVEEEGSTSDVPKAKKKKSKSKSFEGNESKKRIVEKEDKLDPGNEDRSNDSQMIDYSYLDTLNVHSEVPTTPTVDYSTLGDFEEQVGFSNIASFLNPLEGGQGTVYPSDSQNRSRTEKPTRIQVKFGNLNIGKLSNLNIGQDSRPANTGSTAMERPPYLPGERDMKLSGEFEFHGALSSSSSWERCTSTIQFDRDTKKLWQELQRPYGNQSSFLRHLVILEKHWRNGSLVLAENPNPRAVKYINSVQNRVQAYDGARSVDAPAASPKQPEVSMTLPPPRPMSTPIKVPSAPPPLMKIAPGSTPWLHGQLRRPPPYNFPATATQTSATGSRLVPVVAPPPYRFPVSKSNHLGPRTGRMLNPSPSYTHSRGPSSVRPLSISYQQFKKIRLEQPPVSSGHQVTIVPKVELPVETQSQSQSCGTSTNISSTSEFIPLICDVRSLATTTADWNESFRKQQQKMLKQNVAKYYTPILPKIPNSLTVTTFPQTTALVMKTSSLTIEKATDIITKPNLAPPEKPSISVFRETTPSDNG